MALEKNILESDSSPEGVKMMREGLDLCLQEFIKSYEENMEEPCESFSYFEDILYDFWIKEWKRLGFGPFPG